VTGCCGQAHIFSSRVARHDARRYRRRGLGRSARAIARFLQKEGIDGLSVLEVGGGIGDLQLELLGQGAARAVNVELSPDYEAVAQELIRDAGAEERVERLVLDFAHAHDAVRPADAVVLNRVVCCYPDGVALVGAAADRTQRYLVLTFPNDSRSARALVATVNFVARLLRWQFRMFAHPPAALVHAAQARGLRVVRDRRSRLWQLVALAR